jgi:hypothetical protein
MSEAYAPLRDCNVTRITFPAIVAGMENGFVADRLNFVDTSFGETFLGKSRGLPWRQTPPIRQQRGPVGPDEQAKQRRGSGRKLPQDRRKTPGDQATKAKARRLEQSRTRPAAVRARKPSETGS